MIFLIKIAVQTLSVCEYSLTVFALAQMETIQTQLYFIMVT